MLRVFPRPFLQRVAPTGIRLVAIFYMGNKVTCPISGKSYRKFLPYGRENPRANALCPDCLSLERHRLLWLYMKDMTDFFTARKKLLHIAPEQCLMEKFRKMKNLEYVTADLESHLADLKFDLHNIPLDNNSFDAIICNHVMEHVENDRVVMRELFRVMKPGGWGIFLIPLYFPLPEETIEDLAITDPIARERLFGQGDHVRKYGMDYMDRLKEVGFSVKADKYASYLSDEDIKRYALQRNEIIFFCQKDSGDLR